MKFGRMILGAMIVAVPALLSACNTTCGYPDVCDTGTAAYPQFTQDEVASMTSRLDALAGVQAAQ